MNVADFRYLEVKQTSKSCMHEEIKSRLNLENACHHLVQTVVSSCLLSNSIKAVHFLLLFYMSMKLGLSHSGKNIG